MSRDEFWTYIEQCRQHSDSMPAFNRLLETMLDPWELPKLAAFHKVMWRDIGVYNDDDLWAVVEPLTGIGGDDTWECYGGWLIAQGRKYHEAVMQDPKAAAARVPPLDDIFEGESVIFVAQRLCGKNRMASGACTTSSGMTWVASRYLELTFPSLGSTPRWGSVEGWMEET